MSAFLAVPMDALDCCDGFDEQVLVFLLWKRSDERRGKRFDCRSRWLQVETGLSARRCEGILGRLIEVGMVDLVDAGSPRKPRQIRCWNLQKERNAGRNADGNAGRNADGNAEEPATNGLSDTPRNAGRNADGNAGRNAPRNANSQTSYSDSKLQPPDSSSKEPDKPAESSERWGRFLSLYASWPGSRPGGTTRKTWGAQVERMHKGYGDTWWDVFAWVCQSNHPELGWHRDTLKGSKLLGALFRKNGDSWRGMLGKYEQRGTKTEQTVNGGKVRGSTTSIREWADQTEPIVIDQPFRLEVK